MFCRAAARRMGRRRNAPSPPPQSVLRTDSSPSRGSTARASGVSLYPPRTPANPLRPKPRKQSHPPPPQPPYTAIMSTTFDPPAAWSTARRLFATLIADYGQPALLMQERLAKSARRALAYWLDALEAALRQLLLIAALDLPPQAPQPPTPPRNAAKTPRQPLRAIAPTALIIEAAPAFRLRPPNLAYTIGENPPRPRAARRQTSPTRVLARRMLALTAVLDNVDAHVRRLARLLHANAKLALHISIRSPARTHLPHQFTQALRDEILRRFRVAPLAADSS